ncbi:MAG: hypothetical protein IJY69_05835 [Clostridia bacterium]|nr:hypothetical protein [Clostridia bacterium]
MKRIIRGKEYDTDSSTVIYKRSFGSFGDPTGYEEILYQCPDGSYFLYSVGGAESKYPSESIKRMSRKSAEQWLSQ